MVGCGQHGRSLAANIGGLTGGVDDDVGDLGLGEGHGDLDVACDALGGGGVDAGGVLGFLCRGDDGDGAQHTGGSDAEGAGGDALEEVSAGKFFSHTHSPLIFIISLRFQHTFILSYFYATVNRFCVLPASDPRKEPQKRAIPTKVYISCKLLSTKACAKIMLMV